MNASTFWKKKNNVVNSLWLHILEVTLDSNVPTDFINSMFIHFFFLIYSPIFPSSSKIPNPKLTIVTTEHWGFRKILKNLKKLKKKLKKKKLNSSFVIIFYTILHQNFLDENSVTYIYKIVSLHFAPTLIFI